MPRQITTKQKRIMQLICEERTNKEIAEVMGICIRSVETHRHNIIKDLDLRSSIGIAVYAIKNGIYVP